MQMSAQAGIRRDRERMHLVNYSKALDDTTRLRLVNVLLRHELAVNEIVAVLELKQSRISRHLKILSEAGLAEARRNGQWVFYRAVDEGPAKEFLDAVAPLMEGEQVLAADMRRADEAVVRRAEDTARFFDGLADDWERMRREALGDFPLADEVLRRLPAVCPRAADLGCGPGDLLARLRGRAREVIGVDYSQAMLDLARRRLGGDGAVSLRLGDLEHLPLGDAEAQCAVMTLVLHHLPNPGQGLAEVGRVLAPNGVFVLVDFTRHDAEAMRSSYGDRWLGFDMDDINKWLDRAGFADIAVDRHALASGLSLFIVTARKTKE